MKKQRERKKLRERMVGKEMGREGEGRETESKGKSMT